MKPLLATRRASDLTGVMLYTLGDPGDPQFAALVEKMRRQYPKLETARVDVDFSPATSGALNVPLRSEVEAERDRFRALTARLLEELRLIRMKDCGATYDTTVRIEAEVALSAVLPQQEPSGEAA